MNEEYYVDVFEKAEGYSDYWEKWFSQENKMDPITICLGFDLIYLVIQNYYNFEIIETPAITKYKRLKRFHRPIIGYTENDIKLLEGDHSNYFVNKLEEIREILNQKYFESDLPEILPGCHIEDNLGLNPNEFSISLFGVEHFRCRVKLDNLLAVNTGYSEKTLDGAKIKDPVFGILDAYWIPYENIKEAQELGYAVVDIAHIIILAVREIVKKNIHLLINHETIEKMIEKTQSKNPGLISEVISDKKIPKSYILEIIRLILKDDISVYNFEKILEIVLRFYKSDDPFLVYTKVRETLALQIGSYVADKNRMIKLINISSEYLSVLEKYLIKSELDYPIINLPLEEKKLLKKTITSLCKKLETKEIPCVIECPSIFRFALQELIRNMGIQDVTIISEREVYYCERNFNIKVLGEINNEGFSLTDISNEQQFSPLVIRERSINFFLLTKDVIENTFSESKIEKEPVKDMFRKFLKKK